MHFLANFLGYAARTEALKPVFAALAEDLAQPENREPLTQRALQTPLGDLAAFLDYAARTEALKPVFTALAKDLAQPENRDHLARSCEVEPLDKVVTVLRSRAASGLWEAVFAHVDAERWGDARRKEQRPNPEAFVAFLHIAAERGQPALAEAPALRLVLGSTQEEWHRPGIALHHFSHVLRLARGASPADVDGFLERVVTPEWLDRFLESAPTGALAGNLLALATTLQPAQQRRFQREALGRRIARELSWSGKPDVRSFAEGLSLLGASRAIGLSCPLQEAFWPDVRDLAEVLKLRTPDPDRVSIGSLQIQLWLGLREMACWRTDSVLVPPDRAERILDLWQASERSEAGRDFPTHVQVLNVGMIAWLQRCQAAGWRLVPPGAEPTET